MNKLGGWARIGIVISILWSIAVFGLTATEYHDFSKEYQANLKLPAPPEGWVIEPKATALFYEWSPVDLLAEDNTAYVRNYNIKTKTFFIAWIAPIVTCWTLSIVIVFAYKWVRAGFSREDNKSS